MTIENETTKKISDGELLADIENTQLEMRAYSKLDDGFYVLSRLPENIQSGQGNVHFMKSREYSHLFSECSKFLEKLLALKDERGL